LRRVLIVKNVVSAALALCFASSAQAALPPAAESLRRIAAISQSHDVFHALPTAFGVTSITENANGSYTLIAGTCSLNVTVEPIQSEPPQMVPPLQVSVGRLTCLPE
jgi:hypothetical protein